MKRNFAILSLFLAIVACYLLAIYLLFGDSKLTNQIHSANNNNHHQQQLPKPSVIGEDHKDSLSQHNKCWLKERFDIIRPCSLCNTFDLESNLSLYQSNHHPCSATGYKELIECSQSGPVERACRTNWRHFLSFLSSAGIFGGLFGLLVKHRQLQLRCKTLARFSTRHSSESDESSHTLIDMNNQPRSYQ